PPGQLRGARPAPQRGGRAVGTVGQVGAEGREILAVAARPRQTTRRGPDRGWGLWGPRPDRASSGSSGEATWGPAPIKVTILSLLKTPSGATHPEPPASVLRMRLPRVLTLASNSLRPAGTITPATPGGIANPRCRTV